VFAEKRMRAFHRYSFFLYSFFFFFFFFFFFGQVEKISTEEKVKLSLYRPVEAPGC